MDKDQVADFHRITDISRILTDDSIVVDVGAHIGEFSKSVRSVSNAHIFAFEPVPEAFKALTSNLNDHKFHPINVAVSVENGKSTFHVTESLVGSSLLAPRGGQTSKWLNETNTIEVNTMRLDTFFEFQKFNLVSLLKTDAEGFDLRVLDSAGRFMIPSFVQAVLVEMSFHLFHEDQDKFYKVIEWLCEKGYFLAGFYPHYNHKGWLWWADVLFLPNDPKYSTNI